MMTKMRYVAAAGIAGLMVLGISAGAWGTGLNPNLMNPTPSSYVQECIDKWEDAPAYSYCSSASVTRIGASTGSDGGKCIVDGPCSVTATVGGDEASDGSMGVGVTTWTPGVDLTLKKRKTDNINICFSSGGSPDPLTTANGWRATVRKSCSSAETTVADAVANGLSEVISQSSQ